MSVNDEVAEEIRCELRNVWKIHEPHEFQVEATKYLYLPNKSAFFTTEEAKADPRRLLLVRKTGEGKSIVYRCQASLQPGVTVVLSPTLVLGNDALSNSLQDADVLVRAGLATHSFHLDNFSSQKMKRAPETLVEKLKAMCRVDVVERHGKMPSVILFVSPQALTDKHEKNLPWNSVLCELADAGILRLFVIDEAHLFVEQGASFRPEFVYLKHKLFDKPDDRVKFSHHDCYFHPRSS